MVFDPCVCYELVCLPHGSGVTHIMVCASQCTRGMATVFIGNKDKAPLSFVPLTSIKNNLTTWRSECGGVGFCLNLTM